MRKITAILLLSLALVLLVAPLLTIKLGDFRGVWQRDTKPTSLENDAELAWIPGCDRGLSHMSCLWTGIKKATTVLKSNGDLAWIPGCDRALVHMSCFWTKPGATARATG